jgi:hypothetical protein
MNEPVRRRQQLQLWLILGITGIVLAAGFLLVPRDEESRARLIDLLGTSNHGRLLAPVVPIAELPMASPMGIAEQSTEWAPRWRLFVVAGMPCEDACRDVLHVTRQVHVRLGRNADRLERVLLVPGLVDDEILAWAEREHPHMRILQTTPAAFAQWPGAQQLGWDPADVGVFLVDPQGAAMLYFAPEFDGADLLADLNHLLKYSPEP